MFNLLVGSNVNTAHSNNASPRAVSESQWTAGSQSNENSPNRFQSRSQSIGSSYSEATSCASTSSSAVKTRQINTLKLEVELRDHRIAELEASVEDSRRQAECSQGQLSAKLDEQTHASAELAKNHTELKGTVEAQMKQLDDMRKAHEALMATFQQMATHCSSLQQEAESLRKEKERQQEFLNDCADFVKMETHTRRALFAEYDDICDVLVTEEKIQHRRARISEKARIQVEEEEAALLQQVIAAKRAQLQVNQQPISSAPAQQQQQRQQQYVVAHNNNGVQQQQQQRPQNQQQMQQLRPPIMQQQQQQQQRPGQPQQQQQQEGKKCVIA